MTAHKEEKPSWIRSESRDRVKIKEKLAVSLYIDPLDPANHPDGVGNIVTGRIGPEKVNAPQSVNIGKAQMRTFEESSPTGFNGTLSKEIATMSVMRKCIKLNLRLCVTSV